MAHQRVPSASAAALLVPSAERNSTLIGNTQSVMMPEDRTCGGDQYRTAVHVKKIKQPMQDAPLKHGH
jgi:hypothetical protein